MASGMPLPIPPRTPTPPPEEADKPVGLGLDNTDDLQFNPDALSPLSGIFPPARYGSLSAPLSAASASPRGPLTPSSIMSPYSPMVGSSDSGTTSIGGSENIRNPFNFQTVQYTAGRPAAGKLELGRRRGHKYKHSSVSHQIFLEPAPRAPLQVPASLPIPTFKEFRGSMSREQTSRALWCVCHLFVAGYIQWSAHGSLAMTALSHMLFFDALGAILCVAVDVGGNFEVWKRPSIRYPFGLERSELLAGLAMAVMLLFMGLDLTSHGLTHALENTGTHKPHHSTHTHSHVISPGSVDVAALAAILTTLISALFLKNHARTSRALRLGPLDALLRARLPPALRNPSHLLTLTVAAALLLLSLCGIPLATWPDRGVAFGCAGAMVWLGGLLCGSLGRMLLMSYSGPAAGVKEVVEEIGRDAAVREVQEARFWRVHYGLCMANLKLKVGGKEEGVGRLRDRVASLVRNRLGGGYGSGGGRWEISTQVAVERAVQM